MAGKLNLTPVKIEGVPLIFRNIAGGPDRFNKEGGKRYFHAILPPEMADEMIAAGWNIKTLVSKFDDEPNLAHIKINVNLNGRQPPRMVLVTAKGRTTFPVRDPDPEKQEELQAMLAIFDMVDVAYADIMVNPYQRDPDSPVTAYLKTLFLNVREDELEQKYADVPELEYNAPLQIEGAGPYGEIEADPMLEGEVLEDTQGWD